VPGNTPGGATVRWRRHEVGVGVGFQHAPLLPHEDERGAKGIMTHGEARGALAGRWHTVPGKGGQGRAQGGRPRQGGQEENDERQKE